MKKILTIMYYNFKKMLNKIRVHKWEYRYTSFKGEKIVETSTDIVLGSHIILAKSMSKELQFDIVGLGLTKTERDLLGTKFMKIDKSVSFYFFKWIITYYKEVFDYVLKENQIIKTVDNKGLGFVLYEIENKCENFRKKFFGWYYKTFKFKKTYTFVIQRYWERPYVFESDMLSAFQLASNYEADLLLNGKYIFSPLSFEWEENERLVKKYLGKGFVKRKYSIESKRYVRMFDFKGYQNMIKNYQLCS